MPAFDTLKYFDTLKAAGIPESQARAQTTASADVFEAHFDRLATKDDLRLMSIDLQGQIGHLKWMFGIIAAAALLSVAKQFFG
jgi:hypothetical protein